jgi:putative transposase
MSIVDSLEFCQKNKGLVIYAWCLMSNHLHMVVKSTNNDLSGVLRDFKKHTAREIIKNIKDEPESRRE